MGDLVLSVGNIRSGVMKKIVKLSDNFVLAWCGNRKTADQVFRLIYERFRGKEFSCETLRDFLTSFSAEDFGSPLFSTRFIGWVVDSGNPVCFVWRTDFPSELFIHAETICCGGGSDFASEFAFVNNEASARFAEAVECSKNRSATTELFVLSVAGYLMSKEHVAIGKQDTSDYGYGYEILYYDGQVFRYLTDTAYFTVLAKVGVDPNNPAAMSLTIDMLNPRYKVFSTDKLAGVVHILNLNHVQIFLVGAPGLTGTEDAADLAKLKQDFANDLFAKFPKYPNLPIQESQYYCVSYVVADNESGNYLGHCIQVESSSTQDSERLIHPNGLNVSLDIPAHELLRIYNERKQPTHPLKLLMPPLDPPSSAFGVA